MTLRSRVLRLAALTVTMLGVLAALVLGGAAAGAAPAPAKPAPTKTTPKADPKTAAKTAAKADAKAAPAASSTPLTVSLPGLLTVKVDLSILGRLLGGGRTAAATPPTPATTPAAPGSRVTAPPTPAATSPSAAPAPTPATASRRQAPDRTAERVSRQQAVVADVPDRASSDRPAPRTTSARPQRPASVAESFQGMLRTGLPIWLLVAVVVMCGLGTIVVVRSAGRRPSGAHRDR